MPEHGPEAPDRSADRPEDVTDPLLWKLALGVADAHGPDEEGACRNLGCAGQRWPCVAWHSAQHALQVAQAGTAATVSPAPRRGTEGIAPVEWPTAPVPTATRRSAPEDGVPRSVIPAA